MKLHKVIFQITCSILVIFFIESLHADYYKDNITYNIKNYLNFKGKIRSVSVYEIFAQKINGKIHESAYPWLLYSAKYDVSKERILQERTNDQRGLRWWNDQYPLDPEHIAPMSSGVLTTTWIYKNNKLTSLTRKNDSGLYTEIIDLDISGKTIKSKQTEIPVNSNTQIPNKSRAKTQFVVLKRNKKGQAIKRIFKKNGKIVATDNIIYNSQGQIQNLNSVMKNNKKISRTYLYDSTGRIVKISSSNQTSIFTFKNNQLLQHENKYSPTWGNFKVFSYDNKGRLSKTIHKYPSSGQYYEKTYSYGSNDSNGNWTVRNVREVSREGKGEPNVVSYKIIKRSFSY